MKQIQTRNKDLTIPAIGLGCMRNAGLTSEELRTLIAACADAGMNFFDHADIYAGGEAERVFGENKDVIARDQMIIQTKCAIRPGVCYDFSKEYIISSVEGSLKRLKTDYVDILLLHRPDTLMETEEVAEALAKLESEGKVKYFGVSNMNAGQFELLDRALGGKLLFDQVQYSIAHCDIIDSGLNFNVDNSLGIVRDGGLLEYARLKGITLQAWSPFQYGMFEGTFIGSDKFQELNKVLNELAEKYSVSANAIAIAWILRHPANMQAIVGSTNVERVKGISKAADIRLTREEWYRLYMAAGKTLP